MLLVRLLNRLAYSAGMLAERYPSQVAAAQVVALCIGVAALALFGPRQLLETAVKFRHLPAHLPGIDAHLPRQMRRQVGGNDPVTVAVGGHQLEAFYAKGHFLQAHFHAPAPALRRRFERVQVLVAARWAQAPQAVVFPGRAKRPASAVQALQVGAAGVPGSKQHGARQHLALGHELVKQGQKMVLFRELVVIRRVDALSQGQQIARLAAAVPELDQPAAGDQAVGVARVLALGHFAEAAVLFVLYAVVHQQKRLGRIGQQRLHQFAPLTDRQSAVAQKRVHLVVARVRQMRRQMGARVVRGRTQQVLDVSGLGQHQRTVLPKLPQSA